MSFGFGTSNPAPAPAGGGFSFGSAPAPAGGFALGSSTTPASGPPGGGFSFGARQPAPGAASTGGFSFGSTTTSAPAFGATSAPAFGATSQAAFGATSPAASAGGGFSFGSAPAPAPGGFGFGPTTTQSPHPGGFSSLGTRSHTPHDSSSSHFGAHAAHPHPLPSSHTPYTSLPDTAKREIDSLHELILKHRRTMLNVSSMAPSLLTTTPQNQTRPPETHSPADIAAGPPDNNNNPNDESSPDLPRQIAALQSEIQSLSTRLERSLSNAKELQSQDDATSNDVMTYAVWPIEALAARRGVYLTPREETTTTSSAKRTFLDALDRQAAQVDRIERIPSPYLWKLLRSHDDRLKTLMASLETLRRQLSVATTALATRETDEPHRSVRELADTVRAQCDAFVRVAGIVAKARDDLDGLKERFRSVCRVADDPFRAADAEEAEEERKVRDRIRSYVAASAAVDVAPVAAGLMPVGSGYGAPAPAPSAGGGFFGGGGAPGLFGAPAPAPGGLFGGAPAPAPPTGGLFGAPAPAPATGGLFGAPAPAPTTTSGGLFGNTTTTPPTPATSGFFGATSAPTPSSFGFGAAPTAPSTTPAFGTSSKSKSKTRTGRSRR